MARAPSSPTSRSGRSVPLRTRSSAGKRPAPASAGSSATTVVSPPTGSVDAAITVSEPPSAMARAAASARRAAGPASGSSESMSSTAWPPRAAMRLAISTARSIAWTCASLPAPAWADATGSTRPSAPPLAPLLRAHAGERDAELELLASGERAGDAPQRLALAGERAAGDRDPRAASERRQPLDRAQRRVVGVERDALRRPRARQLVERRALRDLLRRLAVDRLDAHERRVALGAPRRAERAADAVAGDELAAADLGGGDVDVVVGRIGRREAQEAGAVRQQLDDAAHGALGPGLAIACAGAPVAAGAVAAAAVAAVAVPSAAAAAAARAPGRPVLLLLGLLVLDLDEVALDVGLGLLGLGLGVGLGVGLVLVDLRRAVAQAPAPPTPAPRPRLRLGGRLVDDVLGERLVVVAALVLDDAVDELGLAQAAEAVDAELRRDRVQIGERARLQGGAGQNGHGVLLRDVGVGRRPAALCQRPATRYEEPEASGRPRRHAVRSGVSRGREST